MAIDPRLVSIKKAKDLPTADAQSTSEFIFFEDQVLKKSPMSNIYDKVDSGLLPATTSTVPSATGFHRYIVHTAGTYTNFSGIVVSADDLDVVNGVANNEVILEVNNGVATKRVRRLKGDLGPAVPLVATTGTSTTSAMHQKAVTDAINNSFLQDSTFSSGGYISTTGVVSVSAGYSNSGYVRYFGGDITVSGYASTTTRILYFYDKYLQPISGYDAGTGVKNNLVITANTVPLGTYFILSQSRDSDNNGKLQTALKFESNYLGLDNYKNNILMLPELDSTTSTPTFDTAGQIVSLVHKDSANRTIRTDSFTFSDTYIVESRIFAGVTKTFTTELSTLKTIIL